jgi:hypothetical protein
MAWLAKSLQVVEIISAAFGFRLDVIDLIGRCHATLTQTGLA